MNVIAIILARGGSKGIHKKNIVEFCGRPLLAWSILQAKESSCVNAVYVSSDSSEILEVAEQYGAYRIKRPGKLATDTATSESALLHALDHIEQSSKNDVELVVFLQATSPLREAKDIDEAVKKLRDDQADSLFSSARLQDFFIWGQKTEGLISLNYDFKRRLRRQETMPQYVENGSIYVFKPEILRRYNNRFGGRIATYEMEFWKTWEIDSLEDKELCEWYFQKKLLNKERSLIVEEIQLIVYDFDGVMTDNRVLTLQDGTEAIFANRADGLGVAMLKEKGIPQVIISTEANQVVEARARKLGLPVYQDSKNKLATLVQYCNGEGIHLSKVLYVGNDVNDLDAMRAVGFSVAPADAHPEVKEVARVILSARGGEGVIRELADRLRKTDTN